MTGWLNRHMRAWAALLLAMLMWWHGGQAPAAAKEPRASAGLFDYYVLALSWSPTYCLEKGFRRRDPQCVPGRMKGFVLHGLWPQFRKGWPAKCRSRYRFVPDRVIREVLDVMPSKRLVIHEWRKHGTCSGLSPRAYFAFAEKLFRLVRIPPPYVRPRQAQKRSPRQIAREFAAVNHEKGFTADSFAVVCSRRGRGVALLKEVRVCFTPLGRPSRCGANEQRARCRARVVVVPPVR